MIIIIIREKNDKNKAQACVYNRYDAMNKLSLLLFLKCNTDAYIIYMYLYIFLHGVYIRTLVTLFIIETLHNLTTKPRAARLHNIVFKKQTENTIHIKCLACTYNVYAYMYKRSYLKLLF